MEVFDSFNVVNKGNRYIVSKDGKQCLDFSVDEDINIHLLEKCGSNGTLLLQLMEEFARSQGIATIKLQDASEIITECLDESGDFISIPLAAFKIITTGKSWYNKLGYFSSCDKEKNEEIIKMPAIEAIYLGEEERIKKVIKRYSIEYLNEMKQRVMQRGNSIMLSKINKDIENRDTIIAEKINDIKEDVANMVSNAIFPLDLQLNVKELLLDYDCFLTKTLSFKMSRLSSRLASRLSSRLSRTRCKKHCGVSLKSRSKQKTFSKN